MTRQPGRPIEELITRQKIELVRQAYLANVLPPLQMLANILGISRSMVGKIIHNKAHYSPNYGIRLEEIEKLRVQFLEDISEA